MNSYDFFVSHHQIDSGVEASLLAETLRTQGFRVFLDVDVHQAGSIERVAGGAIAISKAVLLVVGRNFSERVQDQDDWVRREAVTAKALHKPIVPIFLPDVSTANLTLPQDLTWISTTRCYRFDRLRIKSLGLDITQALKYKTPYRFTTRNAVLLGLGIQVLLAIGMLAAGLHLVEAFRSGAATQAQVAREVRAQELQNLRDRVQLLDVENRQLQVRLRQAQGDKPADRPDGER